MNYHVWRIAREARIENLSKRMGELSRQAERGADPMANILIELFGFE